MQTDGVNVNGQFPKIIHYVEGTPEFESLPQSIQYYIHIVNDGLRFEAPITPGGPPREHVVGFATFEEQGALIASDHGFSVRFGPRATVMAYGFESCINAAIKEAFEETVSALKLAVVYKVACQIWPATGLASQVAQGGPENPAS